MTVKQIYDWWSKSNGGKKGREKSQEGPSEISRNPYFANPARSY